MIVWSLLMSCTWSPDGHEPAEPAPSAPPAADPGGAAVAYVVRLPEPHTHRVVVEATVPTAGAEVVELWMPTWTPGSYLIREFARNIEQLEVFGTEGSTPVVDKVAKNRWAIHTGGADPITVRYELYARELDVRSNFVDAELGVLNGAPTFLVTGDGRRPLDVRIEPPEGWAVHTALPTHPDQVANHFLAPDLDTLVDSPILLGAPDVHSFDVAGVPHHLITLGTPGPWDHDKAAEAVQRVVAEEVHLWGSVPYAEYRFLNVLSERGGGLEHHASTLMMASRYATVREEDFHRWLGLVSHEFFHTWNIKRLRPVGLGPFDYENEVYTRSLWVAEGITSYYDDLVLKRAGILDEEHYLERLGKNIERLQGTPGRLVTPLSQTSFDAWITHYRRNENTSNQSISYYTKGAVVGWLLDAEIRRLSGNRRSLDTLMRRAFRELTDGYTPEQFRALASDEAGTDLSRFFAHAVDSTDELDYLPALAWWGLRFTPAKATTEPEEAKGETDPTPGWHGADTRDRGGRLLVTGVPRDTPAWNAGINVDDELVAFDGHRLTPGNHEARWKVFAAGTTGTLTVARRGMLRPLQLTLGTEPDESWTLEPDPDASAEAVARRRAWLTSTRPAATPDL